MMLFKSKVCALLLTVGMVACAPSAPQKGQLLDKIPDYVLKFAPLVYFDSKETFFPIDVRTFLKNVSPLLANNREGNGLPKDITPDNVNHMNELVFLTANLTKDTAWMHGTKPDSNGRTGLDEVNTAVIIVQKEGGVVDVFYMHLFGYCKGGKSGRNHVGAWEYTMVRFVNYSPKKLWYSQNANGEAYTYDAVTKHTDGLRPLAYSAEGSHENHAMIPKDKVFLWDPLPSARFYQYDVGSRGYGFTPLAYLGEKMTAGWMKFQGKWGNKAGGKLMSSGPTGPTSKQLERKQVCPNDGQQCTVKTNLLQGGK